MNRFGLGAQRAAFNSLGGTMFEKKLTAASRNAKPSSAFALPGERKYPVDDRAHAANALSRSSGKGVYGKVKAAACSKFPDLPSCKKES